MLSMISMLKQDGKSLPDHDLMTAMKGMVVTAMNLLISENREEMGLTDKQAESPAIGLIYPTAITSAVAFFMTQLTGDLYSVFIGTATVPVLAKDGPMLVTMGISPDAEIPYVYPFIARTLKPTEAECGLDGVNGSLCAVVDLMSGQLTCIVESYLEEQGVKGWSRPEFDEVSAIEHSTPEIANTWSDPRWQVSYRVDAEASADFHRNMKEHALEAGKKDIFAQLISASVLLCFSIKMCGVEQGVDAPQSSKATAEKLAHMVLKKVVPELDDMIDRGLTVEEMVKKILDN